MNRVPVTIPTRRKRLYPVSSFGPQLIAVWLKGTREEVRLEFPNKKIAQQFQLRLQMLRGAMTREGHEHAELVQRARTSLRVGIRAGEAHADDPEGLKYALLVVYPADSQFTDILDAAGVKVSDNDALLLGNPEVQGQKGLESGLGDAPITPEPDLPFDETQPNPINKYLGD